MSLQNKNNSHYHPDIVLGGGASPLRLRFIETSDIRRRYRFVNDYRAPWKANISGNALAVAVKYTVMRILESASSQ